MDAFIAASRFGLGARAGELSAIHPAPKTWLLEQLIEAAPTPELDAMPSSHAIASAMPENRMATREQRKATRKQQKLAHARECAAWMQTAASSGQPFRERLIAFFANHFTVSISRKEVMPYAGAFLREAIRPHVLGQFEDLLLATMRHPAMLLYLDSQRSIGPDSPAGLRNDKGLNENHAREILELHTLGVDGGYGTGGAVLLAGGAVQGGTVHADWPGLSASALLEGRDLRPTTDVRSLFKGLLIAHLGADRSAVERVVFPNTSGLPALTGLFG